MKFQLPALLALAVSLVVAPRLHAQVTLTLNSTDSSATGLYGYTDGEPVTLSLVLDDAAFNNVNTQYTSTSYSWTDADGNGAPPFASATLTGASGTYQVNADTHTEIYLFQGSTTDTFYIYLGDQSITESQGLLAAGTEPISTIDFEVSFPKFLTFSGSTTSLSPSAFLQSYDGTYTANGTTLDQIDFASGTSVSLTADSLTISGSAVPEPSTSATILSVIALGGVFCFRRRVAKA